jgi:prepilin signal peptidase PulO-like enzyme (type II secretory pathway)
MRHFTLAMAVVYMALGLALLVTNVLQHVVPNYRSALGAVLLGYGAIRLWSWYRKGNSGNGRVQ